MSSANLQQVLEEIRALTPDEQRQVRKLIDELLENSVPSPTEDLLEQRLLEAGVISEIPARVKAIIHGRDFKPIEVQGKPVSETIIEERR